MSLLIVSTHPIQYQAPVYRELQSLLNVPVKVLYGSDFSVVGYQDREFGVRVSWENDLLHGYESLFLPRVSQGGAKSVDEVNAKGILPLMKAAQPSAVLLLGYRFGFDLRAFAAAYRLNIPLLFRAEATDHARHRGKVKQLVRDTFLRWYYRQFDKLLYIGQRAKEHYQRLGVPSSRLVFSPYCVDTTPFSFSQPDSNLARNRTRTELGISPERIVLLMSGKLIPRKNPSELLQAVKLLPSHLRENVTVMFLGDGELKSSLEMLSSAEPAVDTRFIGFKNQGELSPYYLSADLLVMPSSVSETWGLVVNEALHHGLPCIVSNQVGCAPDLIIPGVSGEIFPVGSSEALAEAIQKGFNLIGASQTQNVCREIVSRYSVKSAAQGIAQAYLEATRLH